jgi:hypothetical protein
LTVTIPKPEITADCRPRSPGAEGVNARMEPDRECHPAGCPRHAAPPPALRHEAARLCDAWRRRSLANGWLAADDWHSEAVNAVVAAACAIGLPGKAGPYRENGLPRGSSPPRDAGRDALNEGGVIPAGEGWPGTGSLAGAEHGRLALACVHLGRTRARAGVGISETIDDLAALFAVMAGEQDGHRPGFEPGNWQGGQGGAEPPLHLVCSIAEGWAEEGMAQFSEGDCEDPLSGLATLPYLRTRLAEVYREAAHAGTSPSTTHRLLLVRLPRRPDPWRRMAQTILIGHDLRAAFPGGETLSLVRENEPGPAIALVRACDDLALRYARLRRTVQATFGTQTGMFRLPGLLPEALSLVDQLAH